jgi:predicted phosphoadenosine phosphosulfate sulfurtransferase
MANTGTKIRKKNYQDENVLEASLNRIRYLFEAYDNVEVSFSGGKDSTAVLNLALKVAREKNKLPLVCHFYDEEAIHPTTIEYVERVMNEPDIKLYWYCLEFKHRNASSNEEPFWYTWDSEKKDLWVREMPECAITEHPKFYKGLSFQEFTEKRADRSKGLTCDLTGVRTQESLRRHQAVARKVNDNYISRYGHYSIAHPIYDWSSQDVWKLVEEWGCDYNKTYDIFNKTELYGKFLTQRVCPPFGEEPLRGLWVYAECFPDMWHKMLNRVSGVATAWRYANTELYGVGGIQKPDNITWKEYLLFIIETYSGKEKVYVQQNVNSYIKYHQERAKDKIDDTEASPLTGISYRWLCKIAQKGDFKGRQKADGDREAAMKRLGLTQDDAVNLYGTEKYKQIYFSQKK